MIERVRCQSCGMPIEPGYFGTNKDFTKSKEFCMICFKNGEFINPYMSMSEMIDRATEQMRRRLRMNEADARILAEKIIPNLSRWKQDIDWLNL